MTNPAINETLARRVLEVVDAGLTNGLGKPVPGQMCVEAAVCYAMGLPHSDEPSCVGSAVRAFKIQLNDAAWPSNEARAKGMRKLAVAQLGSDAIDQAEFARLVVEGTIRRVLPIVLRAAASCIPSKHADALNGAADRCEREGTKEAADAAAAAAADDAARAAARAAAYAAAYVAAAAYAVAAADDAARAAARAAAYAAAYVAAAYAARVARVARESVLILAADVALDALKALNAPGCAFLPLCD